MVTGYNAVTLERHLADNATEAEAEQAIPAQAPAAGGKKA